MNPDIRRLRGGLMAKIGAKRPQPQTAQALP